MSDRPSDTTELPLHEVFDRKSLDILIDHILESGALGRSKVYANLLQYLVKAAGQASSPKEIEIAMEVLGRDVDFDVSKDSVVRVYVHQLRKKLDRYYSEHYPLKFGQQAAYRLVIPKGEYTVAAMVFQPSTEGEKSDQGSSIPAPLNPIAYKRSTLFPWAVAAVILLAANLSFMLGKFLFDSNQAAPLQAVAKDPIWQPMLGDNSPILLVVGDFYIFGELDEAGNVKRMVREFSINSKMDLEDLFMVEPELAWKYYDLDLTYIPEGSAFALNSISAILPNGNKSVDVKMMSELTTEDITTHHIIYIGYVSGLDRLHNMVFAASGLSIGNNYDELINKDSRDVYTSTAGLPSFSEPFTDYGFLSFLPSANDKNIMAITGMRDAGLIHTAKALGDAKQLKAIHKHLNTTATDKNNLFQAYEVLFEVQGINRKNFNAKIVYSRQMDQNTLFNRELSAIDP